MEVTRMFEVPFSNVLAFLEAHGWVLQRVWGPYRVFVSERDPLPFLIPVCDRKVSEEYIKKIEKLVGEAFPHGEESG
jgi:predicted RNA binding protein YcfA (HicA-like mRNA interferase family)